MEDEHITIQIFMQDSLISEKKEFLRDFDLFEDTIPVGTYTVKYYINHSKDITQTINGFEVKPFKITSLILDIPRAYYYDDKMSNDTSISVTYKDVISLHLLTGNNFVNRNAVFNGYNEFGFKIGVLTTTGKYISFGQQFGSSMNYTYFNRNNSLVPYLEKDSEKYYYWNINYLVFTRLTTFNNKTWNTKGIFLDGGISYNFPLMFRYVVTEGNTKVVTSRIHRYNDFSGVIRLGYKPISIMFEYRLTNFLDEEYPEQPKIKLGISLMLADN